MQSFKALLHHRAASRPGGVLVGLFWTDPDEIDRSMPKPAMRLIAGSGAGGLGDPPPGPSGRAAARGRRLPARPSCSAGPASWSSIATVLVYAPPLYDRIGGRLGPVRIFGDQAELWRVARRSLESDNRAPSVRVFPHGGLTYAPRPR